LSFVDQTKEWNSPWDEGAAYNHSMRMADLDGSGIKTYLAANGPADGVPGTASDIVNLARCGPSDLVCIDRNKSHGNYVMVNDGTGQFHVALHEEFVDFGDQVNQFITNQLGPQDYNSWETPRFMPYLTKDSLINFAAETSPFGIAPRYFVNVPLGFNLTTDFKKSITIAQRNGSRNIRTFAGDDIIYGGNNGGTCNVNGGNGLDTVVYNGPQANYTITQTSSGYTVKDNVGKDGTDNLRNVEMVKFQDTTMELDYSHVTDTAPPPPVSSAGTTPDSDGDGVPDAQDLCPTFPGKPEANGC